MSNIEILCNGEFGGGDYTNISSYSIKYKMKNDEEKIILLDGGSFDINNLFAFCGEKCGFDAMPKIVFLSHAHIDHSKDFLLNLKEFCSEDIKIISDITYKDLETLGLLEPLNEEEKNKLKKQLIDPNIITNSLDNNTDIITEIFYGIDMLKFYCFKLDHANYGEKEDENSYALAIENTEANDIVIYFGDFTVNTEKEDSKSYEFIKTINEKFKGRKINTIFAECAFPDITNENQLYGHLKPSLFKKMYYEFDIFKDATQIIITHRKPSLKIDLASSLSWDMSDAETIIEELKKHFEDEDDTSAQSKILFPKKSKTDADFPKLLDFTEGNKSEYTSPPDSSILGNIEIKKVGNIEIKEEGNKKQLIYNHVNKEKYDTNDIFNVCVLSAPLYSFKFTSGFNDIILDVKDQDSAELLDSLMNGKFWPKLNQLPTPPGPIIIQPVSNPVSGGYRKKKRKISSRKKNKLRKSRNRKSRNRKLRKSKKNKY